MKFVVIAFLISAAFAISVTSVDYEAYLYKYEKFYEGKDEYHYRFQNFQENMEKIAAHNANPENTWTMGISQFTDWSWEEFQEQILGEPQDCSATNGLTFEEFDATYPTSYDWVSQGVVTPVKNQGQCGSCWTFSTTGAMESHWSIFTMFKPPELSEQQLVDCAQAFNNYGCDGGLPSQAFEYIKYAGGITTESQYPYTAKDGNCTLTGKTFEAFAPNGSANVTQSETAMLKALYNVGPLSIAYEVVEDFMHYSGGVYSSKVCNDTSIYVNHAVLAVGYGVQNNTDYWLVKNSWGASWGVDGYFMIERGVNMCGLQDCVSYPLVGPPPSS